LEATAVFGDISILDGWFEFRAAFEGDHLKIFPPTKNEYALWTHYQYSY